jgi:hypothetical protein
MPEEPVIVTGGSVTVKFKDTFKEETPDKPGEKKHKHLAGKLRRIRVNNKDVYDLDEGDTVEVIYETT